LKEYARREEVVLATKFLAPMGPGQNERGASRKHIMSAVDASLRRLGTDYIDLYQQHGWDPSTPIEETLEALNDLVRAGKVLHIGASNFKAWQFAKALQFQKLNGWTRFISMQVQYNLIYREEEREMIPLCQDQGVGVLAWSALARGFLAGNRTADGQGETARSKGDAAARGLYFQPEDFALQRRLAEVAAARGLPPMQVALAWVLARPGITAPIFGATKLHQIDDAIAAEGVELSQDELKQLDELYPPKAVAKWP